MTKIQKAIINYNALLAIGATSLLASPGVTLAESLALEEVVVTARKREENLQEVPDSITVLNNESLENAGVGNLEDVGAIVPNMSVRRANNAASMLIAMRGINPSRNTEPSVAVVVDGVQQSNFLQFSQALSDVAQIEVLKGPQGSLYGRNALGGAINIVTQQPGDEFEAKLAMGLGNGEKSEISAILSGPLVQDKLYYRLSTRYSNFDGVIHNPTVNDEVDFEESRSGKLQLSYRGIDALELEVYLSYQDVDASVFNWIRFDEPNSHRKTDAEPRGNRVGVDNYSFADATLKASYDFGEVTLSSVTSYSETRDSWRGDDGGPTDLDFGPFDFAGCVCRIQDYDGFTQELRLENSNPENLSWLAGVYYLKQEAHFEQQIVFGVNPFDPNNSEFNAGGKSSSDFDNETLAVFGQLNYDLSDDLALTLGLRYDRDEREQHDLISGRKDDETFSLLQPKVSLSYQLTDDVMVYGTASRGFRSGGFNPGAENGLFGALFESEEIWNYELGAKTTLADGRVTLNGALFYQQLDDHHEFVFDRTVGSSVVYNVPESTISGIELELTARPIENLDIVAGLGLMDSEIEEFDAAAIGFDPDLLPGVPENLQGEGNKLPLIAHQTFNLSAQYTITTEDWEIIPRVDYSWEDRKWWFLDNTQEAGKLSLVNASVTVRYQDNLTFRLWSDNLMDEDYFYEYLRNFQVGAPFPAEAYPAAGRTYGLNVTYDF
nr:TonB-dependent receptor [Pseudomaricurvus alkylphenolicus]